MKAKTFITICLMLFFGALALQAQELIPFKQDFSIPAKYGFKDKNGNVIIEPLYSNVGKFSEGIVRLETDVVGVVSWEYRDLKGNRLGKLSFTDAKDFSEGYAAVQMGAEFDGNYRSGDWGFIDKTGKEVIAPIYNNAHSFSEGLAAVQSSETKKWGFIDKTGREFIPFIFDRIGEGGLFPSEDSQMFKDGKVKVKKDGREFYIDKTGKEIEDDNAVFNKMATAYQSGNFTEAFKLAEQLANKHNADAMNLLGNMYAQGQGTKQNYGMARSWWEMAANKGNAAATGNIGLLYAQGWGVPQNIAEAEKWFKKGADLGDPQSMFNLGNLAFQKGNLTEAKQWIQKAKTAGHPQADAALQQINAASANQQQPRREKN